jgi:hypothetical protein
MTPIPRYIQPAEPDGLTFSICSLVRSQDSYDGLLASFGRLGFTPENSEFLAADNRAENRFDGYSWHKALLAEARGRFVVFCHDDIELIDHGFAELMSCTKWLDETDPTWLLAGIAGGVWNKRGGKRPNLALRISDRFGADRRRGVVPSRVESLDECFMLMRRDRPVISSYDLDGFHFYGPDLCMQAELLGGSSYVVDFHIRHMGLGAGGRPFRKSMARFVGKYQKYFPKRALNTVNGIVEFGTDGSTSNT